MMVVLRSKKRKDDCQFPRYKRWLPLERFFLALMLIAFVAQFCVVLPLDAPFTHTSLMKGGFKTLQPSIKQTTHEFKDTVSALQPPAAKSSDVTYMNNVLRHLTKSPSTKPIRGEVNDGPRPPMKPLVTKQMRDDVPDGLRLLTKQPGTKQILGNGHVDLRPPTRSPDIIQARGDVRNALRPSTRLTQSPNQQSHQTSVQLRSVISEQTTDFQRTHARNYNRQLHLRDQCKLLSQNQTSYRNAYMKRDILRILTSSTLALVYCRVNKAASWYTISILRNVLDCNEDCMRRYSQRIRSLSYAKKKNQIKNSFKFLFVREPYGRLFSTYCNKFYLPKGIWDPIGKDIVRRYRKNPSEDSLKYGYDVTFAELIRYTADEFEAGNKMDAHIRPMYSNCKPCDYEYDFIGKLETFKSDLDYLAHEWKARNITTHIPDGIGEKSISFGELYFVLSFLEKIKYSKIDMYSLYKRAWNYYQITAVISKHIDMPYVRSDNIKFYSFLAKLKEASEMSKNKFSDLRVQTHEAMLQAYSTVSTKDLERLKNVVKEDCLLFGYDVNPDWLFNRSFSRQTTNSFNYFSAMKVN